jgi:hypothetical protein
MTLFVKSESEPHAVCFIIRESGEEIRVSMNGNTPMNKSRLTKWEYFHIKLNYKKGTKIF